MQTSRHVWLTLVAATAAVCVPDFASAAPRAAVEGVRDQDLRERIQGAIGETERPPQTLFQLRRAAREAAERAVEVLRSEGYYAYVVDPEVSGDPPRAVVRVDPGPRFVLADPRVDWLTPPPEPEVARAAEAAVRLEAGAPGRAADVVAGEGRAIIELNKLGYADAKPGERDVVVDHADRTVRPTFRLDAGLPVRLGPVAVETEGRTDPAWVARLAPWGAGERYTPEDIVEYERRLMDTGAYDVVTVALAPPDRTTPEGLRPVVVGLADRARRVYEVGAGWSTSEGVGVEGSVTFYNRRRRADTLTLEARLAQIEQRVAADLILPHWPRPQRTLRLGAELFQQLTNAYDRFGLALHGDIRRRYGDNNFITYGGSLDLSRNEELLFDPDLDELVRRRRDLTLVTGFAGASIDNSDDLLDPRRGWRFVGDLQPTAVVGGDSLVFLRTLATGTAYVPFEEGRTVAAGRLRGGVIVGGEIPGVPSARRFYSGGGGSVRGYAFQAIGPALPDGTPVGGLSVVEAAVEVRRQFTPRWGGAVFVDGGTVGAGRTPDFSEMRFGAGFGVRYHLPFLPIRADVAFPLDRREGDAPVQVYISVGQAF